MAGDDDPREYLELSLKYLEAAKKNFNDGLHEPALANSIHALELGIKALLLSKIEGPIITHNVGGLFGKHHREELGEATCRRVNRILVRYNIPRYPGMDDHPPEEIGETIEFVDELVRSRIGGILQRDPI